MYVPAAPLASVAVVVWQLWIIVPLKNVVSVTLAPLPAIFSCIVYQVFAAAAGLGVTLPHVPVAPVPDGELVPLSKRSAPLASIANTYRFDASVARATIPARYEGLVPPNCSTFTRAVIVWSVQVGCPPSEKPLPLP